MNFAACLRLAPQFAFLRSKDILHSMTNNRQPEESPRATAISNVTLLMLIGSIRHASGHRNNPDSNADDLGRYANDTRDEMQ